MGDRQWLLSDALFFLHAHRLFIAIADFSLEFIYFYIMYYPFYIFVL